MSNPDDPARGVGAARNWILAEFQKLQPQARRALSRNSASKTGASASSRTSSVHVVAILPGKKMPETVVVVSGHYDSLNLGARPAAAAAGPATDGLPPRPGRAGSTHRRHDSGRISRRTPISRPRRLRRCQRHCRVMELARVMSQYEFDKTLAFVSFAGEEQGLIGSSLQAAKAKKDGQTIEAVFNNDIIAPTWRQRAHRQRRRQRL